ncbi:MAG: crossover junction endodeoxyribonuclease RuvC [Planctomycetes bacterium]|nr:crossover junction endodeoxyribonuclease RuvC [Planctomycetota bacterium]
MDVCGIDPGLETTGYAVVRYDGGHWHIRDAGVCRTDPSLGLPSRLAQLEADFSAVLDQWTVEVVGVEQLYSHYKHPRTAVLMGHARGVLIAVAARCGAVVHDYAATQVKRFLTGNGRATKVQVQQAVMSVYGLSAPPEPNDVADALAIAYCCVHSLTNTANREARLA